MITESPIIWRLFWCIIKEKELGIWLEEELITTEEFEKFRNNYLIKIREIEKQIITKQNIVEELKAKINDKGSLVSDIVPNIDSDNLNRLSLVSFIDRIEIGEDNAIHFIFNNIDTVHLLEAIVEGEKESNKKDGSRLISIHQYLGNHVDISNSSTAIGGVC